MIRRLRCALFVGALALTAHVAAQTSSPPKPSKDADITCPYLRQQRIDRHACQIADPDMGREVLDNLKRLKQADNLLERAKDLARDGFLIEAMECCDHAADLCPGSPCAERAVHTLIALTQVPDEDQAITMPNPKYMRDSEPGVQTMVGELMKACHLLMNQGMQHEAAELARQAYALAPQRVQADPLIYKMHLLSEGDSEFKDIEIRVNEANTGLLMFGVGVSPATHPAGASEASEPPTCPYCPNSGKPIREVVPEKTPPAVNYEWEVGVKATGLRLCADCSLSGKVYHVRYKHGRLAIWKTTDAGNTKP